MSSSIKWLAFFRHSVVYFTITDGDKKSYIQTVSRIVWRRLYPWICPTSKVFVAAIPPRNNHKRAQGIYISRCRNLLKVGFRRSELTLNVHPNDGQIRWVDNVYTCRMCITFGLELPAPEREFKKMSRYRFILSRKRKNMKAASLKCFHKLTRQFITSRHRVNYNLVQSSRIRPFIAWVVGYAYIRLVHHFAET